MKERLRLTLGSKFEHNDFSGFEFQPNVRLLWTLHERHTLWGSVSRAVRTPSRVEDDIRVNTTTVPAGTPGNPGPLPTLLAVVGDRAFTSEELLAYELGYRLQPTDWLFLDLATFLHVYANLSGTQPGAPFVETSPAPPHVVVPLVFRNILAGKVFGWS
jgi:iron complex outermembrane recepter protein